MGSSPVVVRRGRTGHSDATSWDLDSTSREDITMECLVVSSSQQRQRQVLPDDAEGVDSRSYDAGSLAIPSGGEGAEKTGTTGRDGSKDTVRSTQRAILELHVEIE